MLSTGPAKAVTASATGSLKKAGSIRATPPKGKSSIRRGWYPKPRAVTKWAVSWSKTEPKERSKGVTFPVNPERKKRK